MTFIDLICVGFSLMIALIYFVRVVIRISK